MTIGQKIKNKLSYIVFIFVFTSCSNYSEPRGAYWEGQASFMHITSESMNMMYSVDITGQKVYLDGFYEVIKKNTDTVVYRIKVKELEFGTMQDGVKFCRIWGLIDESNIQSYLYSQDCYPIS